MWPFSGTFSHLPFSLDISCCLCPILPEAVGRRSLSSLSLSVLLSNVLREGPHWSLACHSHIFHPSPHYHFLPVSPQNTSTPFSFCSRLSWAWVHLQFCLLHPWLSRRCTHFLVIACHWNAGSFPSFPELKPTCGGTEMHLLPHTGLLHCSTPCGITLPPCGPPLEDMILPCGS